MVNNHLMNRRMLMGAVFQGCKTFLKISAKNNKIYRWYYPPEEISETDVMKRETLVDALSCCSHVGGHR
jgi:hypothetical protein